jgi:hypothetical protein
VGGRRLKEGDKGDHIWQMDFIYLYEAELRNLLELLKWGSERVEGERWWGQCK